MDVERDFDTVVTTTRAVRHRLDLDRPVPRSLIVECLNMALQAPTGAGSESWRWVVVGDADQRHAIAAAYRRVFDARVRPSLTPERTTGKERMYSGATRLADNLHRVPWLVLVCTTQRPVKPTQQAAVYGSVFPAVWSFQLALRSRGLGSVLTTLHLHDEQAMAEVLGVPDGVTQCALVPVAWATGQGFSPAPRTPLSEVAYLDRWGTPLPVR